jgi:hypothetical protein
LRVALHHIGMSVAIPGSVAITSRMFPASNAFTAFAVSTIGNGQSRPEVSIVRVGAGMWSADVTGSPFSRSPAEGQRWGPEVALPAGASGSYAQASMRSLALPIVLALVVALPAASRAQDASTLPEPSGITLAVAIGGGAELGLDEDEGDPGVLELEVAPGIESEEYGIRGEVGVVLGLQPDTHVALRPGIRYQLPRAPLQLRVALDASNAREHGFGWRWILVGAATELRVTSQLGLVGEVDTGVPLAGDVGLPLLLRLGATFRF